MLHTGCWQFPSVGRMGRSSKRTALTTTAVRRIPRQRCEPYARDYAYLGSLQLSASSFGQRVALAAQFAVTNARAITIVSLPPKTVCALIVILDEIATASLQLRTAYRGQVAVTDALALTKSLSRVAVRSLIAILYCRAITLRKSQARCTEHQHCEANMAIFHSPRLRLFQSYIPKRLPPVGHNHAESRYTAHVPQARVLDVI